VSSISWGETTRIGDVHGPDNISSLSTSLTAVVTFDTRHHGLGSSGHVAGYLYFTEYRNNHRPRDSEPQTLDLDWGKQVVVTLPTIGTWKAKYVQFDGTTQEFVGPYSNQYINVTTSGKLLSKVCLKSNSYIIILPF
jgi:hypothetical protein